jgi:four helix bundle protein
MNSFRNLNAYTNAKELVAKVYALLKKFPKEEQYALCDQLRRSVVSVPSNIAEGSGRMTTKDQSHFYTMAYASLMEVLAQLDVAYYIGYITQEEFECFEQLINVEAKLLTGLVNKRSKYSSAASTKQ